MAGYIDAIASLNPAHYYPLNGGVNGYTVNDAIGANVSNPVGTRGTNYRHLTNHGAVTFSASGAVFDGTAHSWMSAPMDEGFSVKNGLADPTALTVVFWVKFPNYTQNNGGDNLHFLAKGDSGPQNWMEWAIRLSDDHSRRSRSIANYYWNPNPSIDPQGHHVQDDRGTGAYMAPPEGARRPSNAPAGAGAVNTWHMIVAAWTTTPGDQTNMDPRGACSIYYGSDAHSVAQCGSTRPMNADANVGPAYTQGPLTLGRRVDKPWTVQATIRRLAFFPRLLSLAEMETLRQAHVTYGNTEG